MSNDRKRQLRRRRSIVEVCRKVGSIITLLAFFYAYGVVGGMDTDAITSFIPLIQAIVGMAVGMAVIYVPAWLFDM